MSLMDLHSTSRWEAAPHIYSFEGWDTSPSSGQEVIAYKKATLAYELQNELVSLS